MTTTRVVQVDAKIISKIQGRARDSVNFCVPFASLAHTKQSISNIRGHI